MEVEKPKCKVNGSLAGGRAMCGSIITGGIYCGDEGDCPHKVLPVSAWIGDSDSDCDGGSRAGWENEP